jgi:hypothetical protein
MEEVIDQIMNSKETSPFSDSHKREEIKAKVGTYIATLSSAGQRESRTTDGVRPSLLAELHRGPDPRYTGC